MADLTPGDWLRETQQKTESTGSAPPNTMRRSRRGRNYAPSSPDASGATTRATALNSGYMRNRRAHQDKGDQDGSEDLEIGLRELRG